MSKMKDTLDNFLDKCKKNECDVLFIKFANNDGQNILFEKFKNSITRLNIWSISKSVVALAAGIASDEGQITLEDQIYKPFEKYIKSNNENIFNIKVKHLLTMSCGLREPLFFYNDKERYEIEDWIEYFFNHGDFAYAPGSKYLYSNFNAYILSAYIEAKVGQNLNDYLRNRLFKKVNIGNPEWSYCPRGHCAGANGLYLNIHELSNLGKLILNKGCFDGNRVVSENFIKKMCTVQIATCNNRNDPRFANEAFGYGYLVYMGPIENTVILCGNYGQYVLIDFDRGNYFSVMSFQGYDHKIVRDLLIEAYYESFNI